MYYRCKCSNVIITTPPSFIYCLVLHRLYSGSYYGVTAHTVFSHVQRCTFSIYDGKSILQRHVLKHYCRTLRIYRRCQCRITDGTSLRRNVIYSILRRGLTNKTLGFRFQCRLMHTFLKPSTCIVAELTLR